MTWFGMFLFNLTVKCVHDEVFDRAAALTFSVLLAFFPFLVFLMTLMGFLPIGEEVLLEGLYAVLPGDVSDLAANFIHELVETRRGGLLLSALFFSVYNTTNGFRAIISYTNMAYGVTERRGFLSQVGLSFVLMLLFSAALTIMLGLLVFERHIFTHFSPDGLEWLFTFASVALAILMLTVVLFVIYRLACAKPLPIKHVLPGAFFTVFAWVLTGYIFGFVTRRFTQYSAIYGSIAGVFLLVLWLYVVSVILLIGNEINALLHDFGIDKKSEG